MAVVGAGPAGATCACSLLLNGASDIALIDSAQFPRDKSCGDGIGPGAVAVMHRLGLAEKLQPHTALRALSVSSPSDVRARFCIPEVGGSSIGVGYTIPRHTFDYYITESALARGAADLTGHQFEDASFADGRWTLNLKEKRTEQRTSITADVIVGADGARSRVRRMLGIAPNSDPHTGIAIRVYAKAHNGSYDALQIDFVRELLPAYGWINPIDPQTLNVGAGIDLDNYKRRQTHLEALLNNYQRKLDGDIEYDESSRLAFILPYGSELPQLARPDCNAALIGDAGSMINPLTGEGIFYAMYAGELLGRLLAEAPAGGARLPYAAALANYESQFRRLFLRHFNLNWQMKKKFSHGYWCDAIIWLCRNHPALVKQLSDLTEGGAYLASGGQNVTVGMIFRLVARQYLPFLR